MVRNRETGEEYGRRQVVDCTKEGCLVVDVQQEKNLAPPGSIGLRIRGVSAAGVSGPEAEEIAL